MDPRGRPEESDAEARRRGARVVANAELAQSRVPRGVADLLFLSPERRTVARQRWRARPRGEKRLLFAGYMWDLACSAALIWGVVSAKLGLIVVGAAGWVASMIGSVALIAASDARRRRRR